MTERNLTRRAALKTGAAATAVATVALPSIAGAVAALASTENGAGGGGNIIAAFPTVTALYADWQKAAGNINGLGLDDDELDRRVDIAYDLAERLAATPARSGYELALKLQCILDEEGAIADNELITLGLTAAVADANRMDGGAPS